MSQEEWNDIIPKKDDAVEDARRIKNILEYLVRQNSNTVNYKQAFKSILSNQVQIELAFQSAKQDIIYSSLKGNNALNLNSNEFNGVEYTFKKIRNINVVIELCRACGIFQYEQEFLDALIQKEFESEKKQNSLLENFEKMLVKTLNEYVTKLNRAELSKREK